MTLPNFLIIGAAKSGTTSLYDYMRPHPDIFMPALKEARFFAYDGRGDRKKFPIQSQTEYEALFDGVRGEKAIGEASPHYMIFPELSAERIHALTPGARLIASLRDPVERSFSIYQMNLRNRGVNEGVPYVEALKSDHNLQETYAERLQCYFDRFPRERMRIILLDEIKEKPRRTVQALFEFLGVDPAFEPDVTKVSNPGGTPRNKMLHAILSNVWLRRAARNVLPASVIEKGKDVRSGNLQKAGMDAAEREAGLAHFREDILRTQDMIGRDLSHWLKA